MKKDRLLELIVAVSTRTGEATQGRIEPDITLLVGGALVSGVIISERQFLLAHPITDGLLEGAEALSKQPPSVALDLSRDLLADDALDFIHLAGARLGAGALPPGALEAAPPAGVGACWRVRLADVAGFSLGLATDQ